MNGFLKKQLLIAYLLVICLTGFLAYRWWNVPAPPPLEHRQYQMAISYVDSLGNKSLAGLTGGWKTTGAVGFIPYACSMTTMTTTASTSTAIPQCTVTFTAPK